jgi:hypothetical protein
VVTTTVKDSGKRESFNSGMVRDTQEEKTLYHLLWDGPMLERWAMRLTGGAAKYNEGNWLKASGEEEYRRFRASAARHFHQWMRGDTDEDHASATFFNINGAEYVKERLEAIERASDDVAEDYSAPATDFQTCAVLPSEGQAVSAIPASTASDARVRKRRLRRLCSLGGNTEPTSGVD